MQKYTVYHILKRPMSNFVIPYQCCLGTGRQLLKSKQLTYETILGEIHRNMTQCAMKEKVSQLESHPIWECSSLGSPEALPCAPGVAILDPTSVSDSLSLLGTLDCLWGEVLLLPCMIFILLRLFAAVFLWITKSEQNLHKSAD